MFFGKKPDVSHLRIFRCPAFTMIPSNLRRKGEFKSVECIFAGYYELSKAYKLYNPATHKFVKSRDVVFREGDMINRVIIDPDDDDDSIEGVYQEISVSQLAEPISPDLALPPLPDSPLTPISQLSPASSSAPQSFKPIDPHRYAEHGSEEPWTNPNNTRFGYGQRRQINQLVERYSFSATRFIMATLAPD